MTRDEFLSRFGPVFENRPDLAEAAWNHGPADPSAGAEALHRAFAATLRGLPQDALLAFLNDHPDLAGRAARPNDLTDDSKREQGSAGLDGLDEAATARLLEMNAAYRERFGFPFIMAVKGRTAAEIMGGLKARLGNAPEAEQAEAARQVERILLLRLKDRLGEA